MGAINYFPFDRIKKQLSAFVKLAHPKPEHALCLFSDASDTHWAAMLTQVPNDQRRKAFEDQQHEPLFFLFRAFKSSSANWSALEKDGYAIVDGIYRLDYLITGRSVTIFTDHANLAYIYNPYDRNRGILRHIASKIMP